MLRCAAALHPPAAVCQGQSAGNSRTALRPSAHHHTKCHRRRRCRPPPPQERRISCADALDHPWFREQPLPKDRALMPTFPSTNEALQRGHAAVRRKAVVGGGGKDA